MGLISGSLSENSTLIMDKVVESTDEASVENSFNKTFYKQMYLNVFGDIQTSMIVGKPMQTEHGISNN